MKIYKYYAPRDYNFDALCNNQLFFAKPSVLNDPFDTSDLFVKSYGKFSEALCLDKAEDLFEAHGICCFTKSAQANNRHFWSLYADCYKGYALEYDENELSNDYPPIFLSKVQYLTKALDLNDFSTEFTLDHINKTYTVQQCIDKYIGIPQDPEPLERLFYYFHICKDKEIWNIENEYRMIIGSQNKFHHIHKDNNGYKLDLNPNAIKSITIGYKMSCMHKRILMCYAKQHKINFSIAIPVIRNNVWDVEIKKVF